MNLYRQGDVLICEVSNIPDKAEALPTDGPIILAEGEVTGHHHAIALAEQDDATLYAVADEVDRYLRVRSRAVALRHEEHGMIALPPGDYRVVRQREYHPEAIRRVAD